MYITIPKGAKATTHIKDELYIALPNPVKPVMFPDGSVITANLKIIKATIPVKRTPEPIKLYTDSI
jgi:hypothetical protein